MSLFLLRSCCFILFEWPYKKQLAVFFKVFTHQFEHLLKNMNYQKRSWTSPMLTAYSISEVCSRSILLQSSDCVIGSTDAGLYSEPFRPFWSTLILIQSDAQIKMLFCYIISKKIVFLILIFQLSQFF